MKTTAKLLVCIAGLALAAAPSATAAERNHEVTASGLVFMPQDGLFSTGLGGAATYRYWLSPYWGLTASFGATHVGVKHDRTQVAPNTSGSFLFLPLGGDLTCSIVDLDPVRLNVSAGLRYAFVNSSATCSDSITGTRTLDMTLDDVFFGVIGLDADYALGKNWALYAAANFQADFDRNKLQTADGPLRATELSGFNVQLGLRCNF